MSNRSNFNISQEYEIIPHQKGKVYVVSVKEWDFLKSKLRNINIDINELYSIGYLLIGAGISCLVTIFATDFKNDTYKYLVWIIFGICLLGAIISLIFSRKIHKIEKSKPSGVITQMDLIESRFESQQNSIA